MRENTDEKSLVKINENSIFHKIKKFFINLFNRNKENANANEQIITEIKVDDKKLAFMKNIKNIENEETKLLELQKQYRSGKIKEEDLTQEQLRSLCELYNSQISKLKKSNEMRKQKLLEYRKKLQTDS